MFLKLIFFIFGASQIFALNIQNSEYYYPAEDNGSLMIKMLFSKLNQILQENQEISKNLTQINKSPNPNPDEENFENRLNEQISLTIKNSLSSLPPPQECHKNSEWTLIQRRQDGSIDFNRGWVEYKKGFGNPSGEFFIGLNKLHDLTSRGQPQELWIVLKDFEDQIRYAIYDKFVIGSENEKYALKELGQFRGTAGDSLTFHVGLQFSTKEEGNCGDRFQGAWWFKPGDLGECYRSNLNGPYLKGINPTGGVVWGSFHDWNYSLKSVEMFIRPV